MNLLAFDTATERLAVALQAGERLLCAEEPGGPHASARLLPCVRELLQQAGLEMNELDAIGFGRGPGAFTGLRTSTAVAQGLAFGLGRPVLPVDSLLIVAEDARVQVDASGARALEVGVAMDARMGEVYAARYAWDGSVWQVRQPAGLYAASALRGVWAQVPLDVVAGSALALPDAALDALAPALRPLETDRPGALLRLTVAAWQAGAGVDAADALPLYVRDKVALTTAEREQAAR
jgi:tRNA threonylcarbamoyladenosine biosynthesis protein TsaB